MFAGKALVAQTGAQEYAPHVINTPLSFLIKSALNTNIFGEPGWQGTGWQVLTNYNKGGAQEKFSQDAYWLVDVMAKYQLTEHVSATVNLNNVFDKSYYTNIGFYNSSYYGDPRNVMVTTRWDF